VKFLWVPAPAFTHGVMTSFVRLTLASLAALVLLAGCPKQAVTTVAGSDDEVMDQIAAQLEELRTRTDATCKDFCSLKDKACGLSKQACDVAGKAPDRADFQKKCVTSQEDCAKFNESCSSCPK
jgi:hypothetical protein